MFLFYVDSACLTFISQSKVLFIEQIRTSYWQEFP